MAVLIFSRSTIFTLASKSSGNYGELVEGARDYLGVALVKSFYVSNLEVASGVSSLKFMIQVCGLDGACQKLEDSPFFVLQVQGTKIMKEERLQCKCGKKMTILVSENFEKSGKLDCFYIHGRILNVDDGYKGYTGPIAERYVEMDNRVVQTNEVKVNCI